MMRLTKHALLFALLLTNLLANASASQDSRDDKRQIISSIHAMWKAVQQNDLDLYLQYVHPDYSVFGESDAYLHEGKDKEEIDYRDFLSRAKGVRTFMHQPKVNVRGDTAWITYYWNDAGYLSGERYTSRGKSSRVFVKENGTWLCIHSHFTALP
ncbi:MAG: ketosteroid isomerase-like protein [Arenicella sp.]|jgi:ketosteroid isomerase-like protein